MSCYAKHPDIPGTECWHGPGHAGNHGKEDKSWPNEADPVQVELLALRKVADAADRFCIVYNAGPARRELDALIDALREAGR